MRNPVKNIQKNVVRALSGQGPVRILMDNGHSRITGCNVGKYPRHRFAVNQQALPLPHWPLSIDATGYDVWKKGCYRCREQSELFALEYVKDGVMHFALEGEVLRGEPGSVFLVQLHSRSEMACMETSAAVKRTCVMSGGMLADMLAHLRLDRVKLLKIGNPGKLDVLFDRAESAMRAPVTEARARQLSAIALEMLLFLAEDGEQHVYPEKLTAILNDMDSHLSEPFSVSDLAHRHQLSEATLFRLFRGWLHDTPGNVLIGKRMAAACRLLNLTDDPVKEVAFRTGYANALYFSSEFTKRMGVSPTRFRRKSRLIQN